MDLFRPHFLQLLKVWFEKFPSIISTAKYQGTPHSTIVKRPITLLSPEEKDRVRKSFGGIRIEGDKSGVHTFKQSCIFMRRIFSHRCFCAVECCHRRLRFRCHRRPGRVPTATAVVATSPARSRTGAYISCFGGSSSAHVAKLLNLFPHLPLPGPAHAAASPRSSVGPGTLAGGGGSQQEEEEDGVEQQHEEPEGEDVGAGGGSEGKGAAAGGENPCAASAAGSSFGKINTKGRGSKTLAAALAQAPAAGGGGKATAPSADGGGKAPSPTADAAPPKAADDAASSVRRASAGGSSGAAGVGTGAALTRTATTNGKASSSGRSPRKGRGS